MCGFENLLVHFMNASKSVTKGSPVMAHSHCNGTGTRNDGFLYYAMYCTHYTGSGAETEPLLSIVPIPVPVPVPCSVYKPYIIGCSDTCYM